MPSHLTAFVFRQILRGRPLTHHQCVKLLGSKQWTTRSLLIPRPLNSRRTLFNWGSNRPPPLTKTKAVDPGYTELARLDELLRMNVRPLDADIVIRALQAFFAHKYQRRSPLTDTQIRVLLVALKHLNSVKKDSDVDADTLVKGIKSLSHRIGGTTVEDTLELARVLHEQIKTRWAQSEPRDGDSSLENQALMPYIDVLCSCGRGREGRSILCQALESNPDAVRNPRFWQPVLNTFIAEQDDTEMASTLQIMEEYKVPLTEDLQLLVLNAFAQQSDFVAAQQWHAALVKNFPAESARADSIFLDLCIKTQRLSEGDVAFRRLVAKQPDKTTWDLILRWAAAKRKGVDEVERMMDVMVKRNKEANIYDRPDVETINGLIGQANAMDDPYMAERFVALAHKRGIHLDGKTYALQMAYRLHVDDISGAYKAFQETQSYGVDDDSDLPQIHRLLQKLCADSEPRNEQIDELLATLTERRATYPAETIEALVRFRLGHGEIRAVIDLLHVHAYQLGREQRLRIMDVFQGYILDRQNSVKASWDAYCILREIFPEMDNASRTAIMIDYFARGRSDVAIHVFGHMRQAEIPDERPSTETYALCFQGLGHAGDERSFDLVYNMLKLDSAIEPDTYLRNAIMLAQIGCGYANRALEIWDDIALSREGPTYNSIAIALYAVETTRISTKKGLEIWRRLEEQHVEPNRQIYVAYIGALSGQGMIEMAFKTAHGLPEALGEPLDSQVLGVLYNAAFERHRERVARWAEEKYPEEWAQLQALGKTEKGLYKINRQLTP